MPKRFTGTLLLSLSLVLAPIATAQTAASGPVIEGSATYQPRRAQVLPPREDGRWPGLRLPDARLAAAMVVQQRFLMRVLPSGKRETLAVRSATLRLVDPDRLPPPGADGKRMPLYDLVINGQVLDPREYAILYDERIVNLGALFTYRQEFYPETQAPAWEYGE